MVPHFGWAFTLMFMGVCLVGSLIVAGGVSAMCSKALGDVTEGRKS
jgi:hypothetical protein